MNLPSFKELVTGLSQIPYGNFRSLIKQNGQGPTGRNVEVGTPESQPISKGKK